MLVPSGHSLDALSDSNNGGSRWNDGTIRAGSAEISSRVCPDASHVRVDIGLLFLVPVATSSTDGRDQEGGDRKTAGDFGRPRAADCGGCFGRTDQKSPIPRGEPSAG